MKSTRRQFLGRSINVSLYVGIQVVFAASFARAGTAENATGSFSAFLDTLLPKDESPAATELGIDKMLLKKAASQKLYGGILRLGCRWLDRLAQKRSGVPFHLLDLAGREDIVARAASSERGTLQRVFFNAVQRDAFNLYYSDPRIWPSLHYEGPPQPNGFRDHASAPERSRQ